MKPFTLAILISGYGSNLQSIINAIAQDRLQAKISVVISDNDQAYGLVRAQQAAIATQVISRQQMADKQAYDQKLLECLQHYAPDLVVLSGYMRIVGDCVVKAYYGRMINIHPSLLPKYPGLNTYQRVLESGEQCHGTTIHFVSNTLDGGPIIAQRSLAIRPDDTVDTLQQRTQAIEHIFYPQVLQSFAERKIHLVNHQVVIDE